MWGKGPPTEYQMSARRAFLLAAFALAVALAALTAVTVVARKTFDRMARGSEARQHAYDVLIALRKMRQDIGEMRVGVTGYVVTRDSLYLATYRNGRSHLATDSTTIRRLTSGVPSLQRELDLLQPALLEFDADLTASLVHAAEPPSATGASKPILSRSAILTQKLGGHFASLDAEQTRLLEANALEVQAAVARTDRMFTWVLLLGTILIFGTAALLFVHLRARARAEARLARAQQQLNESHRLESVGQLAGGVAHDFNNILTVIGGFTDLVQGSLPTEHPSQADLVRVREAGQQGEHLTRQLLAFSRRQVLDLQVLDLNAVVQKFRGMLDRVIPENISIGLRLADELGCVRADAGQVEQILMNFCVNARDSMTGGGRLLIETANAELDATMADDLHDVRPGRYVALMVSDTGSGMSEATRARIFEPFFTTKELGKGTGLGLATVYGIVKQSGGHVWVYSEPSHGSTFKVYLPEVDETATPDRPVLTASNGAPVGTETILLVEDDAAVREVTRRILVGAGYRVLQTASAEAAIDLLARGPGPIQMLLTDVIMPGLSGPQLAERVRELLPGIRVLYQSGYSEAAIAQHGALGGGAELLAKPFTVMSLRRKVRETLDGNVESPTSR